MSQNNDTILNVNGSVPEVQGGSNVVRLFGTCMVAFLFIVLAITLTSISTFGQSPEASNIETLGKQMLEHFKAGKYKSALPIAKQLVTLNENASGSKSLATSNAYTNLGLVERSLEKYSEATASFLKAIEAQKDLIPANQTTSLIRLLELLAYCQNKDEKFIEAAETYNSLMDLMEKSGKHESAEAFEILLGAANNQAQAKDFITANELYKKALKVSILKFDGVSEQREKLFVYRTCLFTRFVKDEDLLKDYSDHTKQLSELAYTEGKLLNGKATELPRPKYPIEARNRNLSGTVYVWVRIDPQGKVLKADVICSDPVLGGAAIESARRARFTPSMFEGKPIANFGLITYNFVAHK